MHRASLLVYALAVYPSWRVDPWEATTVSVGFSAAAKTRVAIEMLGTPERKFSITPRRGCISTVCRAHPHTYYLGGFAKAGGDGGGKEGEVCGLIR